MNDGSPQGVLSESDFVRKVAAEDKKQVKSKYLKSCHTSFVQWDQPPQ